MNSYLTYKKNVIHESLKSMQTIHIKELNVLQNSDIASIALVILLICNYLFFHFSIGFVITIKTLFFIYTYIGMLLTYNSFTTFCLNIHAPSSASDLLFSIENH